MTDQAAASAPSANRASGMASLEGRPSAGALLADQMSEAGAKRAKRRDIRPLARLIPFAMRHKGHALMAVFWLLLSTAASLGLTALARGAIDHGFEAGGANLNIWFLLLGANGQVGWELQRSLAPLGELHVADRRQAGPERGRD